MSQSGEGDEPADAGDRTVEPDRDESKRPPEDLRRATREAFATRAPNTDVADIVYDSLVDAPAAEPDDTAERHARELRFTHGETSVALEVVEDEGRPGTCLVTLILTPPRSVKVEIRGGNGPFSVDVDAGRAVFEVAARRLVTIVVPPPPSGGRGVQTAWVRL